MVESMWLGYKMVEIRVRLYREVLWGDKGRVKEDKITVTVSMKAWS